MYARWHMQRYGLTREQLAMVPVVMSHLSARHPDALCRTPYTLEQVLSSRRIAPVTNLLECARRADGAAAFIVSSERHWKRRFSAAALTTGRPVVVSVGESSGPLYPPKALDRFMNPEDFSSRKAAKRAYRRAQVGPRDIDFFGLYDCFPIAFVRALEAVGIAAPGEGGHTVERLYGDILTKGETALRGIKMNTHGGLQCFGAPWEVPAMYNVIEAVEQMRGQCGVRQIYPPPKRALVYGNGGIFSASSVAILGNGEY
jgi:acetyl-CoA acetyltransferase